VLSDNKSKVLVVAAHPDDEVLGCGGTIAKHAAKGDDVSILIIGDGVTARYLESELDKDGANEQGILTDMFSIHLKKYT